MTTGGLLAGGGLLFFQFNDALFFAIAEFS
jgi:hypothetical protein